MKHKALLFFVIVMVYTIEISIAQIPVEVVGGHQKASFDLMFFKFFKKKTGQNSNFLFFSRERAVVDYQQTNTVNLPQFGFTEAISYNHPILKGIAPVFVSQILNRGTYAKTGLQYAHITKNTTVFGWVVSELGQKPSVDVFFLVRYTPKLTGTLRLYTQWETSNSFPSTKTKPFAFVQRMRLGLKLRDWQFGVAADTSQTGRNQFSNTENAGVFLRHEF
jgi:hypothetical protein